MSVVFVSARAGAGSGAEFASSSFSGVSSLPLLVTSSGVYNELISASDACLSKIIVAS